MKEKVALEGRIKERNVLSRRSLAAGVVIASRVGIGGLRQLAILDKKTNRAEVENGRISHL
jgi:hypothetical protein